MSHPTTLKALLSAAAFFKKHPEGRIKTGIGHDLYWNEKEFRSWFLRCLDDKINRTDTRKWRKLVGAISAISDTMRESSMIMPGI